MIEVDKTKPHPFERCHKRGCSRCLWCHAPASDPIHDWLQVNNASGDDVPVPES